MITYCKSFVLLSVELGVPRVVKIVLTQSRTKVPIAIGSTKDHKGENYLKYEKNIRNWRNSPRHYL